MQPATNSSPNNPERVARSLEQRRRRTLLRSGIPLLLSGILICWAAVMLRNRQYSAEAAQRFEQNIAGLISIFEESNSVPLSYPPHAHPGDQGLSPDLADFHYLESDEAIRLRGLPEDLLVAYSDSIRQIFRRDSRMIAVRVGSKIEVKMVSADEFNALRERQSARLQPSPAS